MTPHLIIILSLSASTVGFALLASYNKRLAAKYSAYHRQAAERNDEMFSELCRLYSRRDKALACLTPHSANIGRRMARKLRGEA